MKVRYLARLRGDKRKQSGSAAVEFALTMPVLISVMLGIMECGRLYWTSHAISQAVNDTSRYAMIHTSITNLEITDRVKSVVMGINSSDLAVTITTDTANGKNFMTIQANYSFQPLSGYVNLGTIQISESSRFPRG